MWGGGGGGPGQELGQHWPRWLHTAPAANQDDTPAPQAQWKVGSNIFGGEWVFTYRTFKEHKCCCAGWKRFEELGAAQGGSGEGHVQAVY